ncbi:MAG TPA: hypothetical protein VE985_00670 [Gaiellaceae bacterium]|nr:hypothetical protein [Gaiellaceae bacterium]
MPKLDIAVHAHTLRSRIYHLEQKWTTAYPQEREKLAAEIASLLAEYEALVPEIESEAERRKRELKQGYDELMRKRDELLMLLGQVPEPLYRNGMGVMQPPPPNGQGFFTLATRYELAPLRHCPRYEELGGVR